MSSVHSTAPISLPITFASLSIESDGQPFTLQPRTISTLQNDELLVRVQYASINAGDTKLWVRNAWGLPKPYVLGFDFSGIVALVGSESADGSSVAVGSEVMGCTSTGGCFAEYVVAKRKDTVLRGAIPAAEASTYGIAYGTAYESVMVSDSLQPRSGQSIFIPGAAGGVGHFAVQLAKMHGLTVIGSASRADSLALLRTMGVEHVIDYGKQDVVQAVLALTDGRGVDIVYECTGQPSSMKQSAQCVKPGGTWLKLGRRTEVDDTEAVAIAEQRGVKFVQGEYGRYFRDPVYMAQIDRVVDGLRRAAGWYEEAKRLFELYAKEKRSMVGKLVVAIGK